MSNGIDRSQILSQLKVILTPQEYTACEGLSDTELSAKLREALSNNGNLGVGDTFTFGAMPEITTTPVQAQKPILPTFGPEASIPQLTTEQAQDIAMQNLWAMNANLATAQRETDSDKRDNATTLLMNTEARELYYLDKSRSPQGLTYREYLEGMRGDLRTMLLKSYPQMDSAKINLDERLNSLDENQIRQFEQALIKAETGKLDKNDVLKMFADSTQTVETRTYTQDGKTHTETSVKINPPHSHAGGEEEKIRFEDLYRAQRGVEFNPEKVRQYLIDGTETYFNDPLENGFSNTTLDDLHKHAAYTQRLPKSYIQAFGQPYRAEYLNVLGGSDYDTSTAYGVSPVKLDSELKPAEEGMEYVIPTRDITQGVNAKELKPEELKRFSANMLYNILNTTYNMFKGYYDGAWEQLKQGSVGTAAVQGFLGFGEMLSGQDLTARSQMDKVEGLLAKATQLKNMDDNAFEQHFDELFKEISGTSFDPAAMQNFAQLTMKGIKSDTDEYDEAVKRAFGSNRTGDADSQFSILNPINSVTDIVAFLAGSEVLGSTKLFAALGTKSFQTTAKVATRLGFNTAGKTVQAGIRLTSSSPVSALNMMTYTGLTEVGGTAMNSLAERINIKKSAMGEYMSVLDKVDKSLLDDDMIRILVDMTKQGVMGSVAPFIGAVATKTGNSLAGVFSKGNPTAIQKSFSTLAKAENKTLNAQSLMKDYLSAVDGSTFTKAQEVISKSSAFITEVGGFTGYSTLEHIAEGLITGELDLESIDLGEEFKGQLEGLATLKGVARFIQMRKSGAVARGVQDKALNDMTEQLKNYDITDVGGQYRVLDKTSGKFQTFNSPEAAVNHLFQTMLFKSAVAKAGVNDGVEWRKMNIGGEDVEVAVTKSADGKETVDFSKARKLNANGEYEHFALTTERDLASSEGYNTQVAGTGTKDIKEVINSLNLIRKSTAFRLFEKKPSILSKTNEEIAELIKNNKLTEAEKEELRQCLQDWALGDRGVDMRYIAEIKNVDLFSVVYSDAKEYKDLFDEIGKDKAKLQADFVRTFDEILFPKSTNPEAIQIEQELTDMGIDARLTDHVESGRAILNACKKMKEAGVKEFPKYRVSLLNEPDNFAIPTENINEGYVVFNDINETLNNCEVGYFSTPTPEGIVYHETAHCLNNHLVGWNTTTNAMETNTKRMLFDNVSKYSAMSPSEAGSELFAGMMEGKTYSKEIENIISEYSLFKPKFSADKALHDNTRTNIENTRLIHQADGLPAQDPTQRPRRLDSNGGKDPFELTKQFDEQTLALTGNDVLVQVGTDKEGKPIMKLSPEYEELITNIAKQIREIALSQEGGAREIDGKDDPNYDYTQDKGIVGIMHRMGFTANGQFFHRSKSVQSLHDKIQNALISDPDMPLSALVTKEVRDAVGVRSVREGVDLKNDPDVKALLDAGDRKSAIDLAIEKESAHVFDALMKYIDSVAEGTNEVEITSISNYMGKDGIPYFTERQLNRLRAYAEEKGVPLLIIERVNSYSEREKSDDVFKEKATTKVRGSGYTALQMNFRTKDGFVYEWQYRGTGVNKFAEGEHIPYDLRTNKDIVGKNEELHALFDPIKELLSESKMSEPQFEEYNNYLTAHYEYLRLTELGIVDGSNPPKLPRGFDVRLRAENLELLHEKAEATKKNPEKKDKIYKEYTDEIARRERENPDNFTDQSYTELAEEAKRTRTTSEYEAEVRLGINLEGSNPTEIRQIINECKNENGAISEYYLKESESLLNSGLSAKDVITYLQILKGTSKPVTEEPAIPDRTPDEFGEYVQSQRTLEAFEVSGLKELYEADGKTVEQLFNEKKPDGSPRFSYFDLIQIFKSKNKDFSLSLVETTVYDPVSGQDVPKFEMDVFKRINKCLKDNPHRHEIEDYIQHHLLNNDDIDSAKLKLFVESLDNNSTAADYDVLRSILTDKSVSADKKADAIQSYKDLSPEQKTKIHQGYTADKKAKFSDIFKSATGEDATGESRNIERLISESPLLSDIHPSEIAELKEGSFEQVKESLEMLELFVQKNPHATAQDKAYLLSLHSTSIKQGLILDTKSIIENDLLKDVRLLETLIQVPTFNTNDGQYLRLQVLSQIDYSDPTVFKNNYKYILNSGRYSTKDIIEIMKNGIDYQKRQTELSGQNIDETTRKVLLQTKDISDINGIKETVTNIRQLLGKIEHPDMIADVLNRLNIKDYNAFNQFINRIDMNKLYELAPRMRNFNERDMAVFLGFHYKNGTSSFDKTTLTSEQGFTEFLSKHYLDAGNMSDFLAAFPLTNRNIGALPEGWASNVSNPEGLDSRIQNVIDNFRQTKDMTALANELGQVLNKKVNVDNLGEGVYGHGFKIDVEGSTTVVLKLFFEKPDISVDRTLHGRSIETQTGFYLNGNSNRFVHTFFGRICSHADRDGYMVTQFMGDGVTPIITSGNTAGISIIPTDVSKGHNEANNIIFDLGGTLIKDNNGKNISFDVLKHKRK